MTDSLHYNFKFNTNDVYYDSWIQPNPLLKRVVS